MRNLIIRLNGGEHSINGIGPKKLSRAVADLVHTRPPVGKNSSQCLWAGMHPQANRSQQSDLPDYEDPHAHYLRQHTHCLRQQTNCWQPQRHCLRPTNTLFAATNTLFAESSLCIRQGIIVYALRHGFLIAPHRRLSLILN